MGHEKNLQLPKPVNCVQYVLESLGVPYQGIVNLDKDELHEYFTICTEGEAAAVAFCLTAETDPKYAGHVMHMAVLNSGSRSYTNQLGHGGPVTPFKPDELFKEYELYEKIFLRRKMEGR